MAKMAEDTPLIKQFFEVKAQHPEALLLYRAGDFYETYSDDAVTASRVLGLVQTKKSNGDKGPIPMAGFPHHAIENYLTKLVRAGFKVAICDQLEDPKFAKKLVKRGVTEIVTPGISFGENMLEVKENNFLCGLAFDRDGCGAAFLDVSTGQFQVAQGSLEYIGTLMGSLSPKELVVPRSYERGVKDRFGDYYVTSPDGLSGADTARGPSQYLHPRPHRRGQSGLDGSLHPPQPGSIPGRIGAGRRFPGTDGGPLLLANGRADAAGLAGHAHHGPEGTEPPV